MLPDASNGGRNGRGVIEGCLQYYVPISDGVSSGLQVERHDRTHFIIQSNNSGSGRGYGSRSVK